VYLWKSEGKVLISCKQRTGRDCRRGKFLGTWHISREARWVMYCAETPLRLRVMTIINWKRLLIYYKPVPISKLQEKLHIQLFKLLLLISINSISNSLRISYRRQINFPISLYIYIAFEGVRFFTTISGYHSNELSSFNMLGKRNAMAHEGTRNIYFSLSYLFCEYL
jgi:hypothetical protein